MMRRLGLLLLLTLVLPSGFAREIKIGVGNFPPYFDVRGTTGLFNDVIRETFKLMPDYQIALVPEMSNYRLLASLNAGTVDGVANIFSDAKIQGCRSDPVFRFTDVAVTRTETQQTINSVDDLRNKSIVTYQGARIFLGSRFTSVVNENPDLYQEVPQPMDQATALLAAKHVDVSIGDLYIFLNAVMGRSDPDFAADKFTVHRLFPDTYSHMAFRDQKLCDDFNEALRTLKKKGAYEAIYVRYLKRLQTLTEQQGR